MDTELPVCNAATSGTTPQNGEHIKCHAEKTDAPLPATSPHMKRHSTSSKEDYARSPGVPECYLCKTQFHTLAERNVHLPVCPQVVPHKCTKCLKQFNNRDLFEEHMRRHVESRIYTCPMCGIVQANGQALGLHIREAHSSTKSHLDGTDHTKAQKAISGTLPLAQEHTKCPTEKSDAPSIYHCYLCKKMFSSPAKRNAHLPVCTMAAVHVCLKCGRKFESRDVYELHLSKQGKCITQSASSVISGTLKSRDGQNRSDSPVISNIGLGQKKIESTELQKQPNLLGILGVANGKVVIKCPACQKSFPNKASFNTHIKTHGSNRCVACTMLFSSREEIDLHMKIAHTSRSISCSNVPNNSEKTLNVIKEQCLMSKSDTSGKLQIVITNKGGGPELTKSSDAQGPVKSSGNMVIEEGQVVIKHPEFQKTVSDKTSLNRHMQTPKVNRVYQCGSCSMSFSSYEEVGWHIRNKHLSSVNPRNDSQKAPKFHTLHGAETIMQQAKRNAVNLERFAETHNFETLNFPSTEQPSSPIETNKNINTIAGPHICVLCGEEFDTWDAVNTHLQSHNVVTPHNCSQCDASFSSGEQLNEHILTHKITLSELRHHMASQVFAVPKSSPTTIIGLKSSQAIHGSSQKSSKAFQKPAVNSSKAVHGTKGDYCNQKHITGTSSMSQSSSLDLREGPLNNVCRTQQDLSGILKPSGNAAQIYRCGFCNMTFSHQYDVHHHTLMQKGSRFYQCVICSQKFWDTKSLFYHLQKMNCHEACKKDKSKMRKDIATQGTVSVSQPKQIECQHCGERFSGMFSYNSHMKTHRGKICNKCGMLFEEESQLKSHSKMHEKESLEQQQKEDTEVQQSQSFPPQKHGMSLRSKQSLQSESVEHLECPICSKTLSKHSILDQHIRNHKTQGACSQCGLSVCKPLRQPTCGASDHALSRYMCKLCVQGFIEVQQLEAHLQTHVCPCSDCGEEFPCLDTYRRDEEGGCPGAVSHQAHCAMCIKGFLSVDELQAHLQTHHRPT